MYQGNRFIKYVKPSRAFFQSDPPSKLFSGQELSLFCKHIKRNAQKFEKTSGSKAVAFHLAMVVVYIKERVSIALTGIVLHTDYFIIAEKSQVICTRLPYQEKHPLGTKNVKFWDEGSDLGGNCAWAGTVQTFIISFQTSSSCGKSRLSSSKDTFHCLLNDILFSFPEFFIIFCLFFFIKHAAVHWNLAWDPINILVLFFNLGDFYVRKLTSSWRLELSVSFEPSCFHCRNEDKCGGGNIFLLGLAKIYRGSYELKWCFGKGKQHSRAQGCLKFNSFLVRVDIS